jgi:DNA-binding NtrC family response regulator
LNVHTLSIPPLRSRLSDVAELSDHFLIETCRRFGVCRKRLSPEALKSLMNYEWRRNNVRELRNIIERMIIATDTDVIQIDQVPAEIRGRPAPRKITGTGTLKDLKTEAERQIIVAALDRNDWHITRTAKQLGLADHASLLKIMRRHHLKRP